MPTLEHTIESQTTIRDLAALRIPAEIVCGTLDEFASPGGIRIAERIRGVSVTRVRSADHLVGKRIARAVAAAIPGDRAAREAGASRSPLSLNWA
ncbi:MAG: hypothetical protein QM675_12940 [Protaetiibacter sp.]